MLSISIFSAAGIAGRPGMVIMFPAKTTMNSAPPFISTFLIVILYFPSHFKFFGSSENEYCVLAIQTGSFPYPFFSAISMFSFAKSSNITSSAPYTFLQTLLILSFIMSLCRMRMLK